jgi:chromosome segregation ATPase
MSDFSETEMTMLLERIAQLDAENAELQRNNLYLYGLNERLMDERDDVREQLVETRARLADLHAVVDALKDERDELWRDRNTLKKRLEQMRLRMNPE